MEELPLSTSSAMPESAKVPRLEARVHRSLPASEMARIALKDLHFRSLQAEDMEEMMALRQLRGS